uniref:Uncharacterized protein n=1 Tax=Timema poppense TaxID=170557 RepID=A0A7R9CP11_TIMPO|nr:unnamed protein product [Timema poppensis]
MSESTSVAAWSNALHSQYTANDWEIKVRILVSQLPRYGLRDGTLHAGFREYDRYQMRALSSLTGAAKDGGWESDTIEYHDKKVRNYKQNYQRHYVEYVPIQFSKSLTIEDIVHTIVTHEGRYNWRNGGQRTQKPQPDEFSHWKGEQYHHLISQHGANDQGRSQHNFGGWMVGNEPKTNTNTRMIIHAMEYKDKHLKYFILHAAPLAYFILYNVTVRQLELNRIFSPSGSPNVHWSLIGKNTGVVVESIVVPGAH